MDADNYFNLLFKKDCPYANNQLTSCRKNYDKVNYKINLFWKKISTPPNHGRESYTQGQFRTLHRISSFWDRLFKNRIIDQKVLCKLPTVEHIPIWEFGAYPIWDLYLRSISDLAR